MTGTALLTTRIASAIAALVTTWFLFWAITWQEPGFGAIALPGALIAGTLWWAGTTSEIRTRRRRLFMGLGVGAIGFAIVAGLVVV